jgi:hypothetical protein
MLACKYRPGRKTEAPSWIRGLVLRPAKPHAFFVFYVDYGTEEEVYFKNAKNLDTKFMDLPNQAIRARLSGIQPKSGGMAYLLKCEPFNRHLPGQNGIWMKFVA